MERLREGVVYPQQGDEGMGTRASPRSASTPRAWARSTGVDRVDEMDPVPLAGDITC